MAAVVVEVDEVAVVLELDVVLVVIVVVLELLVVSEVTPNPGLVSVINRMLIVTMNNHDRYRVAFQ